LVSRWLTSKSALSKLVASHPRSYLSDSCRHSVALCHTGTARWGARSVSFGLVRGGRCRLCTRHSVGARRRRIWTRHLRGEPIHNLWRLYVTRPALLVRAASCAALDTVGTFEIPRAGGYILQLPCRVSCEFLASPSRLSNRGQTKPNSRRGL